ncbi:peptide-binding protein, partial [Azospirillum brasilense]|nr:peptide-binding protein [Azospirillum brasilense]
MPPPRRRTARPRSWRPPGETDRGAAGLARPAGPDTRPAGRGCGRGTGARGGLRGGPGQGRGGGGGGDPGRGGAGR